MSNIGRVITLVLVIKDDRESECIWQSLKDHGFTRAAGGNVVAVADGNLFAERDELRDRLDALRKHLDGLP